MLRMCGGITPSNSARSSVTLTCFPINVYTSRLWEDICRNYSLLRIVPQARKLWYKRIESPYKLKLREESSAGVTDDDGERTLPLLGAPVLMRSVSCQQRGRIFPATGRRGPTGLDELSARGTEALVHRQHKTPQKLYGHGWLLFEHNIEIVAMDEHRFGRL